MTFDYPWVLFFLVLPVVFLLVGVEKGAEPFGTGAEDC